MKKNYFGLIAFLISVFAFGQTELVNEELRNGSLPTGWSQTDIAFQTSAGGYARFDATTAVLTSDSFDASAHASIEVNFDIAKFGSGGDGPLTIEYSLDNGSNWILVGNSTTPTGSTYQSNNIPIAVVSSTMRIRFLRVNSPSQKRLRDLIINGIGMGSSSPTVGFDAATSTENETNTTFTSSNIPITVSNYDGNQIDIDVNVTGGTAESGDYTFASPNSLSFTADGTQNITIDINDDADFNDETIELTITETSAVTGLVISQATHTITILDNEAPPIPELIITEIMQNPLAIGDNSGEYFEVYNPTDSPIDMNGWTISDNGSDSHTISSSVIVPSYGFAVLGINANSGTNDGVTVDYEYSNITLSNSDDEIILTDDDSNEIDRVEYDGGATWPDPTGAAMVFTGSDIQNNNDGTLWAEATFSQGIDTDFGSPGINGIDQIIVYIVYTGGSWSSDPSATTSGRSALILDGKYDVSSTIALNDVIVNPGAAVEITSSGTLNVNSFNLESSSALYSSLILDASGTLNSVASITYRRHVNAFTGINGNDLVTSPLTGLLFGDLAQDPENMGTLLTNPDTEFDVINEYAFGPFENDNGAYRNYILNDPLNGGDPVGDGDDFFEEIFPYKGYRAATSFSGSSIAFRGDVNTGIVNSTDFDDYGFDSPDIEIWNLVGNPYPSYLNSSMFLATNGGVIDESVLDPNFNAIYGYNDDPSSGSIWTIINSVQNAGTNIAPGQGFFVASNGTGQLTFDPSMRTTVGTDDFIIGRNETSTTTHLGLKLTRGTIYYDTDFYFASNASRGLDPSYDAGVYSGDISNFGLYSHLVTENQGIPMAIQAFDENDYDDLIVPIGVNSVQGEQITFSISESTLPVSINVYLEDTETNTFTLLNAGDYVLTPTADLNGTGRFYLRFSNSALSITDSDFDGVSIYTHQSNKTVTIAGQLTEGTSANVYDIQGRVVASKALASNTTLQTIDVSNLNTGVYIVKLANGNTVKTQKIILK